MINVFARLASLLNPWRWIMSLRRSMTGASVSLLLIGIVSLNIVWGYPWTGMFAACASLFVMGRLVNYFATPHLSISVNAPRWVPLGTSLQIPARVRNTGRWPGMDLWIEGNQRCDWLQPEGETAAVVDVSFHKRGLQSLRPIEVDSYFPFYLFRTHLKIDTSTTIAVTPQPLSTDDDDLWRMVQTTLRSIASQISQGAQMNYVGSCEYREGVPVRRWDFSSWARLGKPIVREFSTPAARSVTIWINHVCADVAHPRRNWFQSILGWNRPETSSHEPFERILSIAASSIETLTRNGAAVTLWFSQDGVLKTLRCEAGGDPSELLVALASLERASSTESHDYLSEEWSRDLYSQSGDSLLVLSCQTRDEVPVALPPGTRWVTHREIRRIEGPESPVKPSAKTDSRRVPEAIG
ncbi:DUF58 domain-containing protein [Aporhodopirellula aestuarii]|uniref:DUF58 domain-containing protein n=1 Tax=Aporhodopirellula aestuarii TaxID=2950107 RepID=A0ABT0U2J6_9BACT|nr:DUF58 domain-containing protein [Aporhodopirellula aestuarii]MCM2371031.1 DUF58 domain-containing protein [Aporhodopirellula aestuarii]